MSTDILVSFDTTGSMYPALAEVRLKVEQFVKQLFDKVPDLRIALLAHGDYNDVYETKHIDFTTDTAALITFIRTVEPTHGFGNGGELYEKVFNEARSLNWLSGKRAMVMLGDEPPHYKGKSVFGSVDRWNRKDHLVTLDWKEEVTALNNDNITVYPVRCMNRSDSRTFHDTLAKMNNVPLLLLSQFSNIVPLLTAIAYKQDSDDLLESYGRELESSGQLDRGLALAFNLLLNASDLIGGAKYTQTTLDLEAVDPSRFQMLNVPNNVAINDFVRSTGATFKTGKGFYELTKTELVQERKEVVLRNALGDMFSGHKAREMIGLPYGERGRVRPMKSLGYDVFIQSTSANRKLIGGTRFLYETDNV